MTEAPRVLNFSAFIVVVSLMVLLREFSVSTIFCMMNPIPTSSFIQLNDFLQLFHIFLYCSRINIATRTCTYVHVGIAMRIDHMLA